MIVDVGAGMAWNTVDLVIAADFKLIVMTPQLTSIQNAYAFLKTCVQRVIRRLPEEAAVRRELDERFAGDGGARPIRKVLAELATTDALLAERATDVLSRFGALLFGNMLAQPADDQVLTRMAAMIDDYLMIRAPVLGGLPLADPIRRSIDLRQPFALGRGPADAQAALRRLARGILDADVAALRTAARSGVPARTLPIWIDGDVRAM